MIPTTTKPRLEYGAVRELPIRIFKAMNALCAKQGEIPGMDASACERRGIAAAAIAAIYSDEIRGAPDSKGAPTIKSEFLLAPLEAAADTDTLGTLAGTLVSQRYLDIFMYNLPLLTGNRILTDFSSEPGQLSQTTSTRKVVVPGVISYDPTLDTDGYPKGWVPITPPQTTDINITMDELIGSPIQFDLAAISSTLRNLIQEQAPAAAYANALYFFKKLYAVCTAANFTAYAAVTAADANGIVKVPTAYPTFACGLVDFARSKFSEVGAAFDSNEVPDENRTALLNVQYYNKASNDPSIVTFFAGQQAPEIVTKGRLPDLSGFTPIKAPNFPGTSNRFGIFLQRNGLLAKGRMPADLNAANLGGGNGTVTQIVHPESGMAMMVILWSDHKRGYSAWLPCAILGAAKGDIRAGIVGTTQ